MDNFQLAIVLMAITDSQWGARDAYGQRREFSAAEFEALAGSGWQAPDIRGAVTACLNAVRGRWRLAAGKGAGHGELASAESG